MVSRLAYDDLRDLLAVAVRDALWAACRGGAQRASLRATSKDERDAIGYAKWSDGLAHAFRDNDDGGITLPVCEAALTLVGRADDDTVLCEPCTKWALAWAGSTDPDAEWDAMSQNGD